MVVTKAFFTGKPGKNGGWMVVSARIALVAGIWRWHTFSCEHLRCIIIQILFCSIRRVPHKDRKTSIKSSKTSRWISKILGVPLKLLPCFMVYLGIFPSIPHVSCLPVGRDPGGGSLCRAFGSGWHCSGGCLPCSAGGGHRREAGRAGSAVPLRIEWGQFDRFVWDQLRITIDYPIMLVKQS